MRSFLVELNKRNPLLHWFGWYNFALGIVCLLMMPGDPETILGVDRWLKPMKFFLSVWIMSWTMGWILHYLIFNKSVRYISWLIVASMFAENIIIMIQSIRGVRSHFNGSTVLNSLMFSVMGIMILLFTLTVIYAASLYFRQRKFYISTSYLWGIRLGLIFFITFSAEGGIMVSKLSHSVGGADGGPGYPVVNWSREFGDLRIAHFLGVHSLQLLPLAGWYVFKKPTSLFIFSSLYFLFVTAILVQALRGLPVL